MFACCVDCRPGFEKRAAKEINTMHGAAPKNAMEKACPAGLSGGCAEPCIHREEHSLKPSDIRTGRVKQE